MGTRFVLYEVICSRNKNYVVSDITGRYKVVKRVDYMVLIMFAIINNFDICGIFDIYNYALE